MCTDEALLTSENNKTGNIVMNYDYGHCVNYGLVLWSEATVYS